MDLLKPLLGAERTVDALGHYHGCISQTSHPTGSYVGRIQLLFLTAYFFSHFRQYPSIIISFSEIITYIVIEAGVDAYHSSMTIIVIECVSCTKTELSPSSGLVVEPLDSSLQSRITRLACVIEIISPFGRQCPGNVRAIFFSLKLIILIRVPESGPCEEAIL